MKISTFNQYISEKFMIKPKYGDTNMKIHTEGLDNEFVLDEKNLINHGGEGEIFRLNRQNLAKVYYEDQLNRERQEKVLALCAQYQHYRGLLGEQSYAFPASPALRVENDEVIGFRMSDMGEHPQLIEIGFDPEIGEFNEFKGSNLDDDLVIELIYQLHESLERLHQAHVILGDLNPSNILYDFANRRVIFIDLDAAYIGKHECMACTEDYLDPMIEQSGKTPVGNYKYSVGSDNFALAVISYELFTGMLPFTVKTQPALSKNILKRKKTALIGHVKDPASHLSSQGLTLIESTENYEDIARLKTLQSRDKLIFQHFNNLFTSDDRDGLLSLLPASDPRNPNHTFHGGEKVQSISEILRKGWAVTSDFDIVTEDLPVTQMLSKEDVVTILGASKHAARLRDAAKTEDPSAFKRFVENMGFDYSRLIHQGI
jgi:hypothetical protein